MRALGHLHRLRLEDRDLGPRWIIFRQKGNLLEEFAAARIIEELARQALAWLRQTLDDAFREAAAGASRGIGQAAGFAACPHHAISEARRSPMNCQRWRG